MFEMRFLRIVLKIFLKGVLKTLRHLLLATCLCFVVGCGSKKINSLEATNEHFNKRYSTKSSHRTLPILNQVHNSEIVKDDRLTFYDIQEDRTKMLNQKNDEYFYDMLLYSQDNYYPTRKEAKEHENLPIGNVYFLQNLLDKTSTTNHTEELLYFNYLKFIIDAKTDEYKKQIVDPIETIVRNDSDNFVDNHFIFEREKIKNAS